VRLTISAYVFLYKLCLIAVKEKIEKERVTACSIRYTDDLLKLCLPNSTVMLSIRNCNILMISLFALCFVLDKIS